MELLTASTGSYPRIGDSPEQQRHRLAYAQWGQGEMSKEDFERVQDEVTREIIKEQVQAGLDVVTDGQVRWYDQISNIASKLTGFRLNGLLRFADTNTYFRQPVVMGRVEWVGPIVSDEFKFAKGVSPRPVKPVLTGPYTLAKISIDRYYKKLDSLVMDLAHAIGKEIGELTKAGAEIIQVDEPAILHATQDFELLRNAVVELNEHKKGAKLALYTYFGDATSLYGKFQELPIDTLGFDFIYGPRLLKLIESRGTEKELGLGLIDGRNTRMEKPKEIVSAIKRIEAERAYLNPSCGLEYLPRKTAFEKLKNLVSIAGKVKEVIK